MLHVFTHAEVGYTPVSMTKVDAINLACAYLMDTYYPEYSEEEVIKGYTDTYIAVLSDTIVIEVKNIAHSATMH